MQVKKQQLELDMEQQSGSKLGKEYIMAAYCHPVHFQGKPFDLMVIQAYAPTSNTEEAEFERFYEDLQDLLELTHQKDVLLIVGDWNENVGSQETPGVTGKFGLGIWNEAGQRLIEFCQENATGHSKHPLPTTQEKTLHMDITRWSIPKSD